MNSIVTIHGALHPAAGHPADNFTVSDRNSRYPVRMLLYRNVI